MKKLLLVATMLGALASPASADMLLTLNGPINGNIIGPQSASNPCIIAGTQCQQPAGFGFNNFTSNGSTSAYNMYSTTPTAVVADGVQGTPYTSLQIVQAVNSLGLTIAIDVNTAHGLESLNSFEILDITHGTTLAHYTGPTLIGGILGNGNGWADWTLTGFSFAGLGFNGTEQILFHANWDGASDGAESFFLLGAGPTINPQCPFGGCDVPVPGPIVGAGLPSLIVACGFLLAFARRRRQQTA